MWFLDGRTVFDVIAAGSGPSPDPIPDGGCCYGE